ncbi:centromere protein L [Pezoporus wallicus]|uniref:centromere protein L n=1 Tax=Pezoporus wallicus TaxID=35540 RepID=UPI00254C91F8|nr:centromere protein L [Pezoporus wallicus]XP_061307929.1 centromere protein L [Pezoporus flaviventris]
MEALDGAARTLPSMGRLSWGLPFGRADGRCGLSPSGRLLLQRNLDSQAPAFLLRKRWALYSVSPLYKFSCAHLKAYAKLLSAYMAAEKQKGLAVEVGVELDINVAISSLPDLKGSDQDEAAVLVQLSLESQASQKKSEEKLVWSGWFCSVCGDDLSKNMPADFTCLPVFLANGAESYTSIVGSWFQKTFDCCFHRLAISPLNLSWMAAMWSGSKLEENASAMELVFSVPTLSQSLEISYAIHPEDAKALWDTVQKTPGEITQEEVDVFMDCLYSHFHRHFKIHLSATKLVKVSTAVASAHCDGIIKFLQSQYVIEVLMLLTELAISQIQ